MHIHSSFDRRRGRDIVLLALIRATAKEEEAEADTPRIFRIADKLFVIID